MGRGGNNSHENKGRNKKSKGRMSYLRRQRAGGGGGASESKEDEFGQKYGDYVPAYGNKRSGRGFGGKGGGRRREMLRYGMKGFLCTTNFKENECVREAYNILNEYCEEDADPENVSKGETEDNSLSCSKNDAVGAAKVEAEETCENLSESGIKSQATNPVTQLSEPTGETKEDDIDIDDALTSELQNLRSEKTVRKFQRVDTGVNNVVFISSTVDDPSELAYRIFEDVTSKRQTKSRNILRLLPIELTCNANNIDEVKSKAKEIIDRHLKTGYLSFRIIANVRLNGKLKKDDLIKPLAELVSQVNPLSFVDLNNAQYTIVAEVLKTTLCLGIVKDFTKFKKYNLLEAGCDQLPLQVSGSDKADVEASATSKVVTENVDIAAGSDKADVEATATSEVVTKNVDIAAGADKSA